MNYFKSPTKSTISNPLSFFEYFFINKGFEQFHTDFFKNGYEIFETDDYGNKIVIGTDYFYNEGAEFNRAEEYVTYIDNNGDNQKIYFVDKLKKKLKFEESNSVRLILQQIELFKNETEIITFLKKIVSKLSRLVAEVIENPFFSKYPILEETIYSIVNQVYLSNNMFFKDIQEPIIKTSIKFNREKKLMEHNEILVETENKNIQNAKLKHKEKDGITSFKWKSNPEENTSALHRILVKNEVIPDDNDTLKNFEFAFAGIKLTEPLKIRWLIKRSKRGDTKPSIIKIIKFTLMDKLKLIEQIPEPAKLAKTIENIFVDADGKPLKNVYQTLHQMKDSNTSGNMLLPENIVNEEIIKLFKSSKSDIKS